MAGALLNTTYTMVFNKNIFLLIGVLLFIGISENLLSQTDSTRSKVTLVFAGDIMGHGPQFIAAYDSAQNKYDYSPCFNFIKPYLDSASYSIANLEVTFGGKPYTGYPTFSSPADLAYDIKSGGFDMLVMANNHCYDRGKKGFEKTIALLDTLTIPHLGTYLDSNIRKKTYPYILNLNGIKIALLNYTYGTNGINVEQPNIVNYINKQTILNDLATADSLNADYKIAIMHWGLEYQLKPNKEQRDLAQFMTNHGCDAIIGSHPHVVQTFELLKPLNTMDSTRVVPVFYSLGNLMSNQRDRYRDGGAMFSLTIEKDSIVKTTDYNYLPYWVYRGKFMGKYQYYILPTSLYFTKPEYFNLPVDDVLKLKEFSNDIKLQFPNLKESTFYDRTMDESNATNTLK
jgi:poly-gamma-glutamate capsule biosynthesis protein CapA/YwtB (metallophosphatase superfamily)